jgi:hypothetical protein
MSVALMWVAFFGLIQLIGWLLYWKSEPSGFPTVGHRHAKPTLTMNLPPDN